MAIETSLKNDEGREIVSRLASAFDIDERTAGKVVDALGGDVRARIERSMLSRGGVADVLSLVTSPAADRALRDAPDLASQDVAENGNHVLDVLIGNKHISRKYAARAARQTGLDTGTVEKMLPVVASLMIGELQQQSQPALQKLVREVPGLLGAGGSKTALSQQPQPREPIDAGGPLPIPGDHIPGLGRQPQRRPQAENPFDRLPDIIRRGGGPQMPEGGSLDSIIRSIFGNLLGRNRGVIGTMIQLFLIRWLASLARRILSRTLTRR
jgi:hypothetical protein